MRDPDVVVIGAGSGGGAVAWALARRGIRVRILEAGPRYDPHEDYRLDKDNWEVTEFPEKVPSAGRQTAAPLQPLAEKWSDLRSWGRGGGYFNRTDRRRFAGYRHVVGVGGSTLHFSGEAHRMHPAAMRMRSRFGVAADWPMDYRDLEPYYAIAERLIGVAGPSGKSARWRSTPFPLPPHPLSYASQRLANGCSKVGLSFQANSLAALSRPYDDRPGCNYCGNCARGCPRLDKGSADITFVAKAEATGLCTVETGAQVTNIIAGGNDKVGAVEYVDARGGTRQLQARAVVVCCGAVETPRLLLNAAGRSMPDGLGNESGHVGRNFMETLYWVSSGLSPDPLGSYRGLPSDGICWDYNTPDAIPGVIGGCRFSASTQEAGFVGPLNYARRVATGWGREHKENMRKTFGRVLSMGAIGESLPNARTYIDLDPDEKDAQGKAKARIHAFLDDEELNRLAFMANTSRKILRAAGASELFEEYGAYDTFNATHVFGTCRMGHDPANSVVDGFGRSHRWKNLFIADASVFPSTGGGEAPSLTIEALGIRTAEHMARLANSGDL